MKRLLLFVMWLYIISYTRCSVTVIEQEEEKARDFLTTFNKEIELDSNLQINADWDYATNMNEGNFEKKRQITAENSKKAKEFWTKLTKFNWRNFTDPDLKRQFLLNSILGLDALTEEEIDRAGRISAEMEKAYSTATICDFKERTKCDLALIPDIVNIHANSRDAEELKHVWISWRAAVGPKIRHLYRESVDLMNKAAKLNNFGTADKMWLFPYEELEVKDIRSQFESLWEQVKPLYQQLHAYMRFKLRGVYGDIVSEKGPIPAHLLGNVWSQSWANAGLDFKPFPGATNQDVVLNLRKQNFTVEKVFHTAEEFFTSIGLPSMTDNFWKKSIFKKIPDREMACHPSAWDFFKRGDYRIKMCTSLSVEDFYTVHHEMGHIEYYMQYSDQPVTYRSAANPGFHEAIGDLISLSVKSPKHLVSLNLSEAAYDDKEVILNNLYEVGLEKIAVLPFSYLVDQWRWGVFSGNISSEDYNCKWWELREDLQGVEPPVPRTETDFDPASKYHIPYFTPYIRYFVATILQFQFHRGICKKSGEYVPGDPKKPLHMCDIYQKVEAGDILKEMLKMGSSKPWPEALHVVTGQSFMDASAILEYFRPLQIWLEEENRKNGVHIGWEKSSRDRSSCNFEKITKMCDISSVRKAVVFIGLACVLAETEPQLNLPPYPSSTPNYPQSYPKNDINRNYPYNTQYDFAPRKTQDGYDDRDVYNRDNIPRDNPNFIYNLGYPDQQGYSTPRTFDPEGPRNDIPGGRRDGFDPNNPDDRFRNRSPYRGDIRGLLQALDLQASQQCTANVAAQWNFETNVNEVTQLEALKAQQYYSEFQRGLWDLINHLDNLETVPDPTIFRQLKYYSIVGPAALPPEKLDRYNRLINDMLSVYNSANICAYNEPFRCGLRLQPDLVTIMAKSRNWDELQHVWTEWRRNTGQLIKDSYEQMVQISNEAAKLNNFSDTADYWNFPFESSNLHEELEDVWQEVKPLYEQLHTYVRRRLREYYGSEKISRQAPLPAHILGNMWAQSWINIMDITAPYPGQKFLDVTPEMLKQGYAPVDIFRLAEDFFVSLNMTPLPLDFWSGSVLQEPLDRVVLCQPSAWDFCNRRDYRIKMCTRVNMKDLITAHHELAHIHYFMQYKNLPKVFRDGANPAFHEAIGEAIGLSVGTPRHLQSLGLVQTSVEDLEVDINFLYSMALDKLPFLPFAYIMDKWRYEIFRKERLKDQYNCNFWRLSEEYMGIKPPVLRSEMDFDPGSKYHIPANIPYLR
ncbi:angiotensin-converting enzyme-like [Coccinella septempunctata]|uniref:angiotensin-converting enzyme-like n=1 Tax=Coccinella septempunctata TaxID=41139 RepID=UPI001D083590|nr:angiotensin-converting enzyme-like [Coccinella septempunctata]